MLPVWSREEVLNLLRYMDPNADSDLTLAEAVDAFNRYNAPPPKSVSINPVPIVTEVDRDLSSSSFQKRALKPPPPPLPEDAITDFFKIRPKSSETTRETLSELVPSTSPQRSRTSGSSAGTKASRSALKREDLNTSGPKFSSPKAKNLSSRSGSSSLRRPSSTKKPSTGSSSSSVTDSELGKLDSISAAASQNKIKLKKGAFST